MENREGCPWIVLIDSKLHAIRRGREEEVTCFAKK
jgi:hypothetical protein